MCTAASYSPCLQKLISPPPSSAHSPFSQIQPWILSSGSITSKNNPTICDHNNPKYSSSVLSLLLLSAWSTISCLRAHFNEEVHCVKTISTQGHVRKGLWYYTSVHFAYLLKQTADILLLLWSKLPNYWTSYQLWGSWTALQKKEVY